VIRRALLKEYNKRTREYSDLVRASSGGMSGSEVEYNSKRARIEAARVRALEARTEYEKHVAEHGCLRGEEISTVGPP
jgi:hypothetical protein